MTFYIRHVTCKCGGKNRLNCSFAKYSFFELHEKPAHASVKTFFVIHGSFCEIDTFPLSIFPIRNFDLRNLKGNGNAPRAREVTVAGVNQSTCTARHYKQ